MDGYMTDSRGALIPMANVKPEHMMEDELVRGLHARATALSRELAEFRELALGEVGAFRDLISERYGAVRGGAKGNVTLTSYDGRLQMQVAVGETLAFGAELQAAKDLIDACVTRWSEGANANLQVLVDDAFRVSKGRIDTARVLGLRRLAIEDADWKRAMDAIADAVKVVASKSYVRFYLRDPASDERVAIPLDIANARDAS